MVYRIRGASVPGTVAASGVVELKVSSQPNTQFGWALIGAQVAILAVHIRHSRSTNTCPTSG